MGLSHHPNIEVTQLGKKFMGETYVTDIPTIACTQCWILFKELLDLNKHVLTDHIKIDLTDKEYATKNASHYIDRYVAKHQFNACIKEDQNIRTITFSREVPTNKLVYDRIVQNAQQLNIFPSTSSAQAELRRPTSPYVTPKTTISQKYGPVETYNGIDIQEIEDFPDRFPEDFLNEFRNYKHYVNQSQKFHDMISKRHNPPIRSIFGRPEYINPNYKYGGTNSPYTHSPTSIYPWRHQPRVNPITFLSSKNEQNMPNTRQLSPTASFQTNTLMQPPSNKITLPRQNNVRKSLDDKKEDENNACPKNKELQQGGKRKKQSHRHSQLHATAKKTKKCVPIKQKENTKNSTVEACKKCSKIFKSGTGLKIHIKKVHNKKSHPFACEQCQKKQASADDLKMHEEKVHDIYRCEDCTLMFTGKESKMKHDSDIHTLKQCPICFNGFLNQKDLEEHYNKFCYRLTKTN